MDAIKAVQDIGTSITLDCMYQYCYWCILEGRLLTKNPLEYHDHIFRYVYYYKKFDYEKVNGVDFIINGTSKSERADVLSKVFKTMYSKPSYANDKEKELFRLLFSLFKCEEFYAKFKSMQNKEER